jgi:TetR/AcrR family transcriptional regulator
MPKSTKNSKAAVQEEPVPPAKPDKAPSSRSRKLESTRTAILESALSHFARRGFEGASTREISQTAGVRHGMIRHIYGSKDQLWRDVIGYLFERMQAEMPPTAAEPERQDDVGYWKKWVRWYIGYCARHPEHARLMVQQSIMQGPRLEWAAEQFIRSRHLQHFPTIERLKSRGHLPEVDTVSLFFMMTAACQMIYVLAPEVKAVDGRDVFDPLEIDKHVEAVVRTFLRE